MRFHDATDDLVCDAANCEQVLTNYNGGAGVQNDADVVAVSAQLRDAKSYHKSEWSLSSANQLRRSIPNATQRAALWTHINRFTWIAEARAANVSLQNQLCNANGMLWHYHPITFVQHINKLILSENREIRENEYHATNVEIDDDFFFTNFIEWDAAANQFVASNADNAGIESALHVTRIAPSRESTGHPADPYNYGFHFNRSDIACAECIRVATAAAPPQPTPAATQLSVTLVELLERVRAHFNRAIYVDLSYACAAHQAQLDLCFMNAGATQDNDHAMARHAAGVAIDIYPSTRNPARCRSLWNSCERMGTELETTIAHAGHSATQADFPLGYSNVRARTFPAAVQDKLEATPQQALLPEEAAVFKIHLELMP